MDTNIPERRSESHLLALLTRWFHLLTSSLLSIHVTSLAARLSFMQTEFQTQSQKEKMPMLHFLQKRKQSESRISVHFFSWKLSLISFAPVQMSVRSKIVCMTYRKSNVDGPTWRYAKRSEGKTNTVWFHGQRKRTNWWPPVGRGGGGAGANTVNA